MTVYTIRGMDEKTRAAIQAYAQEHDVNVAEALTELVFFGLQHIRHTKKEKKYSSIFEVQKRISFKGGKNLSQEIDDVLYGG
ncbi:MAG: hypothetical protein PHQ80_03870 [Candidatus ainarchaeum sp.]|nr:hypothetical protein [Candidatus ainarchaeum sp.]